MNSLVACDILILGKYILQLLFFGMICTETDYHDLTQSKNEVII